MADSSFIDAGGAAEAEEVALGDLPGSLGFMLKLGHLRARALHEAALSAASLSPAEYAILSCIGLNPGLRQGLLAAALRMKPTLMTKTIRGLEKRSLVLREIPERDRRTVRLSLSRAGAAELARCRAAFREAHAAETGGLTEAEARQLGELLRKYAGIGAEGAIRPGG